MFKIIDQPRAWYPVEWPGFTEDGKPVVNRIEMRFRLLGVDGNIKLLTDAQAMAQQLVGVDAAAMDLAGRYADLCLRIVDDWRGVAAENGEGLKFDRDNLRRLMNVGGVWDAVMAAYRDCSRGAEKVREGN